MPNSELYSNAHERISNHFGDGLPGRKEAVRMFTEAIAKYLAFPSFTIGEEPAPVDTTESYVEYVTMTVENDSNIPTEVKESLLQGLSSLIEVPETAEPVVISEQAA